MDVEASTEPPYMRITAETTELERSKLHLKFAVTEAHTWVGIGGACRRLCRPRRVTARAAVVLNLGRDYLRSAGDCRRLIRQVMVHVLGAEFEWLAPEAWDAAVPREVEARIGERALAAVPGGGGCSCEVSIDVHVEAFYVEAAALLWVFSDAAGGRADEGAAPGAAQECPICYEQLAAPGAARATVFLLGCGHGFHRQCIGRWFEKKPTCPMCRHDVLQYLPPEYRAVRDTMHSESEAASEHEPRPAPALHWIG